VWSDAGDAVCEECGSMRGATGYDVGLDWVIVGGESGPEARPMEPEWPRGIRDQCVAAKVPFLMKQWGEWVPQWTQVDGQPTTMKMVRVGKRQAGRELDGVIWEEWPDV